MIAKRTLLENYEVVDYLMVESHMQMKPMALSFCD